MPVDDVHVPPGWRRAIAYVRQSRTHEGSESMAFQLSQIEEAAPRLRCVIVARLIEPPSTSGYKNRGKDRPRFLQLLEMIERHVADVVIAYKTDRLSRGGGPGWAPLVDAFEKAGVDFDHAVATPAGFVGEFELGMRATMDREESKKTSERVLGMKKRTAEAGGAPGGVRTYGYVDSRFTAINPDEAAVLREAFDRIYRKGESARSVGLDFEARGFQLVKGGTWNNLGQIMRRPALAGIRTHHGRRYPASWPAIFTEAEHQEMLLAINPVPRRQSVHLLSGVMRCWACKGRVTHDYRRVAGQQERRVYACKTASCRKASVRAPDAERYVQDEVAAVIKSGRLASMLVEGDRGREVVEVTAAIDKDKAALERANRLHIIDEVLSRSEYLTIRDELNEQIRLAEARLRSLERVTVAASASLTDLAELWDDGDEEGRRDVLEIVVHRITLNPATSTGRAPFDGEQRLTIEWRC